MIDEKEKQICQGLFDSGNTFFITFKKNDLAYMLGYNAGQDFWKCTDLTHTEDQKDNIVSFDPPITEEKAAELLKNFLDDENAEIALMSRCTARKGLEARKPGTDWTTVIYP